MRADYATSDLISKVNAEWINEVLANREHDRADPGDDVPRDQILRDDVPVDDVLVDEVHGNSDGAGDLQLRREFARKRTILLQRGSGRMEYNEPDIALPLERSSRQRSVARRIKERLALAVAALALIAAAVWMAPEPQDDVTSSVAAQAANTAPEPAAPIDTSQTRPAWMLPEILYGPAMARSPLPLAEASRSVPKTGR
jgi:hypothetical protein